MVSRNGRYIPIVIVAALCLAVPLFVSDAEGGSGTVPYGSADVGACLISFDDNGGSGGYSQYVLNGNTFLFPTEYKAPGLSNFSYMGLGKEGYALTGWSLIRNGNASYYPGQIGTALGNQKYYAVWERTVCDTGFGTFEAPHISLHEGTTVTLDADDIQNELESLFIECSQYGRYILTVTEDGSSASSEYYMNGSGTVSAKGFTANLSYNSVSVTGSVTGPGLTKVDLYLDGINLDVHAVWYISSYDPDCDSSVIHHVSYQGTDYGYGPYHTAVKLPGSVDTRQKGWLIDVNGTDAVFGIGSSYTVENRNVLLRTSLYTYEEIASSGVAGVLAYDCNGGHYEGNIAQLVSSEGTVRLSDGIVSKDGSLFLGWNPTGSSEDAIFPPGYLYSISDTYTEMRAVWSEGSASTVSIVFRHPGDSSFDVAYDVCPGFVYAAPVNGFDIEGYGLIGFSSQNVEPGTLPDDVLTEIQTVTSCNYYPVYRQIEYEYTVEYRPNGGSGEMGVQREITAENPFYFPLSGCAYTYEGYTFAGWSEDRYADSGSYDEGDIYIFTEPGTLTLYAIWTESTGPVQGNNTFFVVYRANGQNVTNLPVIRYTVTSEDSWETAVSQRIPVRWGYDFIGWSTGPSDEVAYRPGNTITVDTDNPTVELYAVWSVHTEPGSENLYVYFTDDDGVYFIQSVTAGSPAREIDAPVKSCHAFRGWYYGSVPWDFDTPLNESITLTAKYLKVFHVSVHGNDVTVHLDVSGTSAVIRFSDTHEHTLTYEREYTHEVGRSGTVTVTVTAVDGVYTASGRYDIGTYPDVVENGDDNTVIYIVLGCIGVLAIILVARRFLP